MEPNPYPYIPGARLQLPGVNSMLETPPAPFTTMFASEDHIGSSHRRASMSSAGQPQPQGQFNPYDHEGNSEQEDEPSQTSPMDSLERTGKKSRKRNRLALSCTECKRRKIRCDRALPCGSCLKRGEASICQWDVAQKEVPSPQPFVLTEDHEALKRRVARLESLFDAASSRPESQEQREVDPETDDATEDAALVLKRMGSGLDQEGSLTPTRIPSSPPRIPSTSASAYPPSSSHTMSRVLHDEDER